MGWVLDLEVNLPNPSAHQVKCVIFVKFVIVCRFFEFKIYPFGQVECKLSNKSFTKIHFYKWIKFSIKSQALELLVHPKVIWTPLTDFPKEQFQRIFTNIDVKNLRDQMHEIHATRNRDSRHRRGVYVVTWPLLLRIKSNCSIGRGPRQISW